MTITVNNYLDIRNLLINEVIGDPWLAYFLILAGIIYLCIKNKLDTTSTIGIVLFYSLIWISIVTNVLILTLILIAVGVIGYLAYTKIHSRG